MMTILVVKELLNLFHASKETKRVFGSVFMDSNDAMKIAAGIAASGRRCLQEKNSAAREQTTQEDPACPESASLI